MHNIAAPRPCACEPLSSPLTPIPESVTYLWPIDDPAIKSHREWAFYSRLKEGSYPEYRLRSLPHNVEDIVHPVCRVHPLKSAWLRSTSSDRHRHSPVEY